MAAIQGRKGELWLQSGSATAFTTEACSLVSGTTYQIDDAAKRQWDPTTTPTVYDDGSPETPSEIQYPIGCVVLAEAPSGAVTVTGKHYATTQIGLVQNWALDLEQDTLESTALGDTARSFVGLGLLGWSATFEALTEATGTLGAKALANATAGTGYRLVWKFYEDEPNDLVWIGYATFTSWQALSDVMALIRETCSVQGDGDIYYVTDET